MAGQLLGGFKHGDAGAANIKTNSSAASSPYSINSSEKHYPNNNGACENIGDAVFSGGSPTGPAKPKTAPVTPAASPTDSTIVKPMPQEWDPEFTPGHHKTHSAAPDDTDTTTNAAPDTTPAAPAPQDNSNRILGGIENADHDRDVRARQDSIRKSKLPPPRKSSGGIH